MTAINSFKTLLKGIVLVLLFLGLMGQGSAYASRGDAELESKVLQIIRNHPETIIESLQAYQQEQRAQQEKQRQGVLQQMKAEPQSFIGQSPVKGSPKQDIVLVEFSDFQCPYCAAVHKTLKQFMAKHRDRVTLVYKHFPLAEIHPQALPAAFSAWAAGQQGKFWEYQDALFSQQEKLGEPLYRATAKALKLDFDRFEGDRNSDAAAIALGQDIQIARSLAIEGTPFLVMNGEVIPGAVELADFEKVLGKVARGLEKTNDSSPTTQPTTSGG